MSDFRTRPVLITGCSSGIGAAIAAHLLRAGWPVYATARKPAMLSDLAAAGAQTMALDVTDESSMERVVSRIEAKHEAVGVLINNAGYPQYGAVEEIPIEAVRRQFETNVFGLLRLTQLVLPAMRRLRSGRIVNIGSMGGRMTFPGGGIYHATKHAVEAISDALRFEVRGFGIAVVLIQPGLIRTGYDDVAVAGLERFEKPDNPYAAFDREVGRITAESYAKGPLARLGGGPEAVAATVEQALTAARPKARYTVTASATLLLGLRRALSDRAWDAFLRRTYPSPGE
jgi:NAD(P)-dependent dehydrogenase (short-subunit alcohol dehydrogenase family)